MRLIAFFASSLLLISCISVASCDKLPGVGNIPGNISVNIVDMDGYPQGYVTIQIAPAGSDKSIKVDTADDSGHAFFKLDPGEYTIYVLGPDEQEFVPQGENTFNLSAGRTLMLEIIIDRSLKREPTLRK